MVRKLQNGFYTNKYQKHVACSYSYKLVCVDDKSSKPFNSNLGNDAVYNFIDSVKKSKHCSYVMEKHFSKELVMNRKHNYNFENSFKCWIFEIDYIDGDVKEKDHFHITENYRGSACRDCNVTVKLNHNSLLYVTT